jgi:hypothetical protein
MYEYANLSTSLLFGQPLGWPFGFNEDMPIDSIRSDSVHLFDPLFFVSSLACSLHDGRSSSLSYQVLMGREWACWLCFNVRWLAAG